MTKQKEKPVVRYWVGRRSGHDCVLHTVIGSSELPQVDAPVVIAGKFWQSTPYFMIGSEKWHTVGRSHKSYDGAVEKWLRVTTKQAQLEAPHARS